MGQKMLSILPDVLTVLPACCLDKNNNNNNNDDDDDDGDSGDVVKENFFCLILP